MTQSTETKNAPDFEVHSVTEKQGRTNWFRLGVAFANKEGKGFTVLLDAQPLGDRLVLLPPKPKDENVHDTADSV
ncbi:hypothetical protein [Cerasicoccus arenae]|uniref:Uncharacterized protein n=1 Tax=Cerasicoccus arenae TaxID=424488 RepID=A0A8J3DHF7_9BACT|nr:hypothetical protein [Cerasicoccus arenae]MBK1859370.1 hypothetical protein [Cerasicoccus arenae]GHB93289.1 hypothetical protein GCM10007047_05790 [Cerasicoccus arenae]